MKKKTSEFNDMKEGKDSEYKETREALDKISSKFKILEEENLKIKYEIKEKEAIINIKEKNVCDLKKK